MATPAQASVDNEIHGLRLARAAPRSRQDATVSVDAASVDLERITRALMRGSPWSVQREDLSTAEPLCDYLADWSGLSSGRIWRLAVSSACSRARWARAAAHRSSRLQFAFRQSRRIPRRP